jgi:hypothetical protein
MYWADYEIMFDAPICQIFLKEKLFGYIQNDDVFEFGNSKCKRLR